MKSAPPLLLLALLVYISLPTLVGWLSSSDGIWYRPFLFWLAIIVLTYVIQRRSLKKSSQQTKLNRRAEDQA